MSDVVKDEHDEARRRRLQRVVIKIDERTFTWVSPDQFPTLGLSDEQQQTLRRVVQVFEEYRVARQSLAAGKYSVGASSIPEYSSQHFLMTVTVCRDGIIVRHERADIDGIAASWLDEGICDLVPVLSEKYVEIIEDGDPMPDVTEGPAITLFSTSSDGTARRDIAKMQPKVIARRSGADTIQQHNRPMRIVDASPYFDFALEGEELDESSESQQPVHVQPFIARAPIRLNVSWNRFEVYGPPQVDDAAWQQGASGAWAEHDILTTVFTQNARTEQYLARDPRFSARNHYQATLAKFSNVLDRATREEDMQKFLTAYPTCLEVNHQAVWPKLALGKHVTDFVIRRATGDYLLVELESPLGKMFIKSGAVSAKLTHAIHQILDWRRYIEDNLVNVQRELGLHGLSANPKSLIVMGRSSDLTEANRRTLTTHEGQCPNLKIMSFDDLLMITRQSLENVLGPIRESDGGAEFYYPESGRSTAP